MKRNTFHALLSITLAVAPFFASAQKIALFDRKLSIPTLFTDSLTVEQVRGRFFPIEVANLDTFYASLGYIQDMLSKTQRAKMQSFEMRAGNTTVYVSRHPKAYGDRYDIVFSTTCNEVKSIYHFADASESNAALKGRIEDLKEYMMRNKSLFRSANSISPRIYNVIVYQ